MSPGISVTQNSRISPSDPPDIHAQQTGTAKIFTAAGQLSFITSLRNGNVTLVITLQVVQCLLYYTPLPFLNRGHSVVALEGKYSADLINDSVICTCILLLKIKTTQIVSQYANTLVTPIRLLSANTLAQST
jgi:hypothetical protein